MSGRRLRVVAPLSRPEEVQRLLAAGADALYTGVVPEDLPADALAILGRRNHPDNNLAGLAALRAAQAEVHAAGRELLVAFNEHLYPASVRAVVLRVLDAVVAAPGLGGVIVADLGLLVELRERYPGLQLVASTGLACATVATARFLRDLGATRVVAPRSLVPAELEALARGCPEVEVEVLVLNDRCPNEDGRCQLVHCDHGPRRFPTQCRVVDLRGPAAAAAVYRSEPDACGACYLPELARAGVAAVKVAGRDRAPAIKERDVRFVAAVRDLVAAAGDRRPDAELHARIRSLRAAHGLAPCRPGLCYLLVPPGAPPPRRPRRAR